MQPRAEGDRMGRKPARAWWMPSVISRTARALASGEMRGPTSVPSCAPLPILSDLAFCTSASWRHMRRQGYQGNS